MTIDERLEALTESCELLLAHTLEQGRQIDAHTKQLERDGEHIRALARIAEIHERRLERLEGTA
ncbi:MAG: hypothetical protein M3Z36_00715 [Acidobacteriota bacterium]|nr:hypothetical protein [Acidobacteriota bacterium]